MVVRECAYRHRDKIGLPDASKETITKLRIHGYTGSLVATAIIVHNSMTQLLRTMILHNMCTLLFLTIVFTLVSFVIYQILVFR